MQHIWTGFIISLIMIIPIGTQNIYVLRQGAMGRHWLAASLTCAICDSLLLLIGGMGAGSYLANNPILKTVAVGAGCVFLIYYGSLSLKRAMRKPKEGKTFDPSSDAARCGLLP